MHALPSTIQPHSSDTQQPAAAPEGQCRQCGVAPRTAPVNAQPGRVHQGLASQVRSSSTHVRDINNTPGPTQPVAVGAAKARAPTCSRRSGSSGMDVHTHIQSSNLVLHGPEGTSGSSKGWSNISLHAFEDGLHAVPVEASSCMVWPGTHPCKHNLRPLCVRAQARRFWFNKNNTHCHLQTL